MYQSWIIIETSSSQPAMSTEADRMDHLHSCLFLTLAGAAGIELVTCRDKVQAVTAA